MSVLEGAFINHISTCIYDKFTMLNITSSLYQSMMAFVNLIYCHKKYAVIRANGEGVPTSFSLGSDGLVIVTTICFSLWSFQLDIASLHIEEEDFDSATGDLLYTIGQFPVCKGDGKHWLLRPRKLILYGLSESIMAASTGLDTPLCFSSCTVQTPLTSKTKN
jgi:hypothetical protein